MAALLSDLLGHPAVRSLLKIGFVIGFFVLGITPLLVIIERRLSAFMQGRVGPNRVNLPWLGRLGGVPDLG